MAGGGVLFNATVQSLIRRKLPNERIQPLACLPIPSWTGDLPKALNFNTNDQSEEYHMRRPGSLPRMAALASLTFVLVLANQLATAEDTAIPPEGKFAEINGFQMYYEVHGAGEPLVLLHGFFGSGEFWKPLVPALAKDYRLIVPDLRNHGRSTNPTGTFTHRQSAKDVFALLGNLGIREFRAMGFSTGGMTLLHMATSQSERIQDMVVFGVSTYLPVTARNYRQLTFDIFVADPQLAFLRKQHTRGDDQLRELIRLWHSFEDNFDDMNFTPPYLSTIQANTLIVHGDRDKYFPVRIAVGMQEAIPRSYLWIVPNGGHVPNFGKPERYLVPIKEFLRGDWEKNNAPR
jgi:pimeloyl-ACP methyl ester carboxylesterase